MSARAIIDNELVRLREAGTECELQDSSDGHFHLVITNIDVPPAYSRNQVKVLIRIPQSYPNGRLDMFWIDEPFTLVSGATPEKADVIEQFNGVSWRRFSWHLTKWNPATDNLSTYAEFVKRRLSQGK